jgi:hypothetical protein
MVLLNRRSCIVKDHVGSVILATESLRPPQMPKTELERQTTHVFLNFLSSTCIGVTGAVGALGRLAFKIAVAISLDSDQLASYRRAHRGGSRLVY